MLRHLIIAGTLITLPTLTARGPQEAPPQGAREEGEDVYVGEMPERHAQVRRVEGQVTLRKGDETESLERGLAVSEGDVVESRGRGVLQLADGTRIAFGEDTRFTILTLFENRRGGQQVVLRLETGRLRLSMGRDGDTTLRIDTPSGRLQLGDRDDVALEVERDRSLRVKVYQGRARLSNREDRVTLGAGERLTAYSDHEPLNRIRDFNTYEQDGFDRWASDHLRARSSESARRVPREIRAYVDDLDEHGEWVRVDDVNDWVWRPRVSVEWRPYWQGRWGAYASGMTWVSSEPWGYVTHHHGRWGWSSRYGWYWIPGAYYAPAWVAWSWTDAHMGWAPLGYWNAPVHWGWGAWVGGPCWNIVHRRHINVVHIHRHVVHDHSGIVDFRSRVGRVDTRGGNFWQQTPLVVRGAEFRQPDRMGTVLQRDIQRTRLGELRQSAPDRVVIQRVPVDRTRLDVGTGDRTPGDRRAVDRAPGGEGRIPFTQLGSRELERRREGRPDRSVDTGVRGGEGRQSDGAGTPPRIDRRVERGNDPRDAMSPIRPPRTDEPRTGEPRAGEPRAGEPRTRIEPERRDQRPPERRSEGRGDDRQTIDPPIHRERQAERRELPPPERRESQAPPPRSVEPPRRDPAPPPPPRQAEAPRRDSAPPARSAEPPRREAGPITRGRG